MLSDVNRTETESDSFPDFPVVWRMWRLIPQLLKMNPIMELMDSSSTTSTLEYRSRILARARGG
jgi:hypothetical protein